MRKAPDSKTVEAIEKDLDRTRELGKSWEIAGARLQT